MQDLPRTSSHPLDMIPIFRRWPNSAIRNVIYTGIWNSLLALMMVVLARMLRGRTDNFMADLLPTLVVANVVGYLIHGSLVFLAALLRGWPQRARGLPRLLYYVAVVGACVFAGMILGTALFHGVNPMQYLAKGAALTPLVPFSLLAGVFMFVVLLNGERRITRETLLARQSEQMANAAQLLAEARLRGLQAQIEPHFLYNTLANVVGLIEADPAQARHMLERFIDYLRASLAASRADSATLGAELDMIAAYLDVLGVRMGSRLRYRFEVADACRDLAIAPMLLQPVIENAVAHGLEPKVDGGEIVLRAQLQAGRLCIDISDTGVGLTGAPPKPGGGVGLSNLRARLRSLYDGGAQVQLLENQPCGITVRLLLPLKETSPSTTPAP
ncbi:MAG: sensor histidine kinase [Massilia sp.]